MKHLLILAVLTLAASLPCVEVDLSDVELSTDSAEALVSFEEAMQKESEAYLDKVSKLRDKYVKKMEYDAKRQKDIRVVMKIEATIKELENKEPVDLFGAKIVKGGKENLPENFILGKWRISMDGYSSTWDFSSNNKVVNGEGKTGSWTLKDKIIEVDWHNGYVENINLPLTKTPTGVSLKSSKEFKLERKD